MKAHSWETLLAGEIYWDYLLDSGQCEINEGFDIMRNWLNSIKDSESLMTLEEAKERYAPAWKMIQMPGFPSTKSFFDGYQCALRDVYPEYFGNISPNAVIKEVEARQSGR